MPYRPEAELKRPDLKGEFLCGHCGKTFCHAASLNRHRLNFHGDDQQCLVCMQQISANDTVRRHMQINHSIPRVFTCGCCNWTFPDKKELHSHNNSMLKTGKPGDAKAIAISSRPPGSLSQHELRGEERTPTARTKRKSIVKSAKNSKEIMEGQKTNNSAGVQNLFGLLNSMSASNPLTMVPGTQIPANWFSTLIMSNPGFMQLLQKQASESNEEENSNGFELSPSSSSMSNIERASTSMTSHSSNSFASLGNNRNNNVGEDETNSTFREIKSEEMDSNDDYNQLLVANPFARDLLVVKTEHSESSTSSGPESGIGSAGDEVYTPSPCSTKEGSPEYDQSTSPSSSSPLDVVNLLSSSPGNRKRKSVDAIASLLFKKKCLME